MYAKFLPLVCFALVAPEYATSKQPLPTEVVQPIATPEGMESPGRAALRIADEWGYDRATGRELWTTVLETFWAGPSTVVAATMEGNRVHTILAETLGDGGEILVLDVEDGHLLSAIPVRQRPVSTHTAQLLVMKDRYLLVGGYGPSIEISP